MMPGARGGPGTVIAETDQPPSARRRRDGCLRTITMQELAFRTLLYRYFFFDWLFKDVSRGDLMARAAAWRFNQSRAHWLLTYMRRWLSCGLLLYGLGGAVELLMRAPALSAIFYVPGALSVPVNIVIGVLWIGLKACPGPLRM